VNVGGFGARLSALLSGEVEAASLLPPQIDMAKQLGLRAVIEDTFHTIWWVPADIPADVLAKYLRALDRAEKALKANLDRFLPLWKLSIPPEFQDLPGISANSVAANACVRTRSEARVRRGDAAGRTLGSR
jgi:hypothetical protein